MLYAKVEIVYYLGDNMISFRCPPSNQPNAWASFPMDSLFECLDTNHVMALFSAVLAERQIVFISSQYSLLTSCAEIVTSLMYPLRWSHVYIPILPRALLGEYVSIDIPFYMHYNDDTVYVYAYMYVCICGV